MAVAAKPLDSAACASVTLPAVMGDTCMERACVFAWIGASGEEQAQRCTTPPRQPAAYEILRWGTFVTISRRSRQKGEGHSRRGTRAHARLCRQRPASPRQSAVRGLPGVRVCLCDAPLMIVMDKVTWLVYLWRAGARMYTTCCVLTACLRTHRALR